MSRQPNGAGARARPKPHVVRGANSARNDPFDAILHAVHVASAAHFAESLSVQRALEAHVLPVLEQYREQLQPQALRYLTLEEWLADPSILAPPTPIVAPLVYEGRTTLLSAREKMGKSTIVGQAVAALTQGRTFLESHERLTPATVLWYAIDEPPGDAIRRLKNFGADERRVILCDGQPSARDVEAAVKRFGAKLVVIDTLSELWAGRLENDRDAHPMALFLRPFMQVARDTGAGQLLLYHTNRGGREFRGSVQLGASVDAPLTLRYPASAQKPNDAGPETDEEDERSSNETRRILAGRTRWGNVFVRLAFNGSLYEQGDGPTAAATQELELRALRAIREGVRSGNALAGVLAMQKKRALELSGRLQRAGLALWSKTEKGLLLTEKGDAALDSGGSAGSEPGTDRGTAAAPTGSRLEEHIGGNRSEGDDRGEAWEPEWPHDPQVEAALQETHSVRPVEGGAIYSPKGKPAP